MSSALFLRTTAFCLLFGATSAEAADTRPALTGNWQGSYICGQGVTGLTLTINKQSGATFSGTFHFFPLAKNANAKEGCFEVTGHFVSANRVFVGGSTWISRPENYVTVDLDGQVGPDGHTIKGKVKLPEHLGALCTTFELALDAGPPVTPAPCQRAKSADLGLPEPVAIDYR